jgi:AraC-like DNA-binding protein
MMEKVHSYNTRQHMISKEYEIFHYSDRGFDKVSLHHHDFYEFYLFLSGDATYMIEGSAYILRPGDIILINSTELHQLMVNNREIPYERIVLWIDKLFLKSLSSESTDLAVCFENCDKEHVVRVDSKSQHQVKNLLFKLLDLEEYLGVGRELLNKVYITELMVYLNTLIFSAKKNPDVEIRMSDRIHDIICFINDHLDEEIRIDRLSEEFFLSKYHLLREFKKHSGTTLHKYIVQKKLILAKEHILKGLPIIEVYKLCGFGDYSNFFRAFKNEYGVTPRFFFDFMTKNGV